MALYSGSSYVGFITGTNPSITGYTVGGTYYDVDSLSAITPRTGVASNGMYFTNATAYDVSVCAFCGNPMHSFSEEYRDTGSTNTTQSKTNISGSWKVPQQFKLNVGGTWKALQK